MLVENTINCWTPNLIYSTIVDFSQLLMLMIQSLRKHFSSTRQQIIMVMITESGSWFSCATLSKLLSFFFSKVSFLKNGDCIFIITSLSSSENWANIHDVLRETTTTIRNIYEAWLLLLLFMKKRFQVILVRKNAVTYCNLKIYF